MALRRSESPNTGVVARLTGKGRFQTEIAVRGTSFFADEPVEVGGDGTGPTPYELLSAALAACTAMTFRLYVERKGWSLPPFSVEVAHEIVPGAAGERRRDRFNRHIGFEGPVSAEQREKLLEIADKCPVHRTLMRGFEIRTELGRPDVHPPGEPPESHERDAEKACAG